MMYQINIAQKMKFSIECFFSKCDQIRSFQRIWSHLLNKSLMVNLIFLCSEWHILMIDFQLYIFDVILTPISALFVIIPATFIQTASLFLPTITLALPFRRCVLEPFGFFVLSHPHGHFLLKFLELIFVFLRSRASARAKTYCVKNYQSAP